MRRPIVGGNWKMNLDRPQAATLAAEIARGIRGDGAGDVDVVLFPPFTMIAEARDAAPDDVAIGGQDMWPEPEGAFTGEISAAMLLDAGARWVIAGHSERRHVIGEDDALIARKVAAAIAAGLSVILCVGETEAERAGDRTEDVVVRQLRCGLEGLDTDGASQVVLAYEPVWAIGTGRTATPADAQVVHALLRAEARSILGADTAEALRIQYGGSVKPANAAELADQPDIDGFLVGGASLRAADFLPIVTAAAGSVAR